MTAASQNKNNVLWFTSTQSWKLHPGGGPAFNGLYMCDNVSQETGRCSDVRLIVDTVNFPPANEVKDADRSSLHHKQHAHHHHRGIDLMNVQIDKASSTLFTGYFEKNRNSFEILSAPLVAPIALQPFFRTDIFSSNNECKMSCCEDATHTYFKVQPRDFVVDNNEIFISWDAFYQDCGNVYTKKAGLKWTVGVSKLRQTDECLHTTGEVSFADCTEPVAIAFQDSRQRQKLLGYAGFSIGSIPNSDKRLFFLSALNRLDLKILNNELWILKEGDFNHYSDVLQVGSTARIDSRFADIAVDDVGTIRLRKDEFGVPTGLCRTAYDGPIVCHHIQVREEGHVEFHTSNNFVTKESVSESCTVLTSDHHPSSKLIDSVATGLEVFWSDDAPDDDPDFVVYGCYGEINFSGNVTTAFRDGRLSVQTIEGAYPGSILKGVDLHLESNVDFDSYSLSAPSHEAATNLKKHQHSTNPSPSKTGSSELFLACVVLIVAALFVFKRKGVMGRKESGFYYDYVTPFEIGATSNTYYVELSAPFSSR